MQVAVGLNMLQVIFAAFPLFLSLVRVLWMPMICF